MHTSRIHGWDHQATFAGKRRGSLHVVVLCRFCGLLTTARSGSSPLRPGPCTDDRPTPPPIVWAARRTEWSASRFWTLRGR